MPVTAHEFRAGHGVAPLQLEAIWRVKSVARADCQRATRLTDFARHCAPAEYMPGEDFERLLVPRRKGAGPGREGAHRPFDLRGGLCPVDAPLFLVDAWSKRGQRIILRLGLNRAA